jgi:hypothetical protein
VPAQVSWSEALYTEYSRVSEVVSRKATSTVRVGQRMKKRCADQGRHGYQNGEPETDIVVMRGDIGEDEKRR